MWQTYVQGSVSFSHRNDLAGLGKHLGSNDIFAKVRWALSLWCHGDINSHLVKITTKSQHWPSVENWKQRASSLYVSPVTTQ